jgi:hypothetical protein
MKKVIGVWLCKVAVVSLMLVIFTGCASSRTAGINTTISHIGRMERVADNHNLYDLADHYEGIAMLSIYKAGIFGFAAQGWSASVYLKDPITKEFGPPSFVSDSGVSGIIYAGLNAVDCLLLFKKRKNAIKFAKRPVVGNFSNEASLLAWGRKQMTVSGANSYSNGAGLAVGLIQLELLAGGSRNTLHENLYGEGSTVDKILVGAVVIPEEIKAELKNLNRRMKE